MRLVIYFCGTNEPGSLFQEDQDYILNSGAKILLVKGCLDEKVCDSGTFPDLKAFASRFAEKVFKKEGDELRLIQNKEILESVGAVLYPDPEQSQASEINEDKIEDITLTGYSRGAVTCFEVAKQLNTIAPDFKLDIVANQPVPGNSYVLPGTNAASIMDCSELKNLNKVSIILGSYTGTSQEYKVNVQPELKADSDLSAYKNSYVLVEQPKCELYLMENPDNQDYNVSTATKIYLYKETIEEKDSYFYLIGDDKKKWNFNNVRPNLAQRLQFNSKKNELIPCEDSYICNYFFGGIEETQGKFVYVNSNGETQNDKIDDLNPYRLSLIHPEMDPNKSGSYSIPMSTRFTSLKEESLTDNPSVIASVFHRAFFSQIVPKLPVQPEITVIAREQHNEFGPNMQYGFLHLHLKIAEKLNELNDVHINPVIEALKNKIRDTYSTYTQAGVILFPQKTDLQETFGITKEEMYKHLDPFHPKPHLRRKWTFFAQDQNIMEWWLRHEKNASWFSSDETRELVTTITNTEFNDPEQLKQLFAHCDKWLLIKNGSKSSRYDQVLALRNNIYDKLIGLNVEKSELKELNTRNKTQVKLIHEWTKGSKNASFFQTKATDELDLIVKVYAKNKPSKENDKMLQEALGTWLSQKTEDSSKRYKLVEKLLDDLNASMSPEPSAERGFEV